MREVNVKRPRLKAAVFLGGGRITSALVAGLRLAGYDKPMVVHDRNRHKLRQLQREYGATGEPNLRRAVEQACLLIVAVRPDSVGELLRATGKIDRPLTAVSLAAGVPLSKLRMRLGPPVRWATSKEAHRPPDRKSTRLNSSHLVISYAVFCLKKKKQNKTI